MSYEHDAPAPPPGPPATARWRPAWLRWTPATYVTYLALAALTFGLLAATRGWPGLPAGYVLAFGCALLARPLTWLFWTRRRS